MQVSETEEEMHLDQLHLVDGARNQKIGTHLIRRLQDRARAADKPLALNVIRGNPARALYERLGFRTDGGDEEKIRMLWSGEPVDTI
jgi:GNAT superfamily N-acetyltransferase